MRVVLIQFGFDKSLALENLVNYARTDSTIASQVDFRILDVPMERVETSTIVANTFMPFASWEPMVHDISEYHPDLIGFSCFMWNIDLCLACAEHLKALLPGVVIVFGGLEVTHTADRLMSRYEVVDLCVRGEGEETFRDLLIQMLTFGDPGNVLGTSVRRRDGTLVHHPPREPLARLDDIPSPWMGLLDDAHPELVGWNRLLYETQRGCPFDCGFCLYGGGTRRIRYLSDERVISDLVTYLKAGINVTIADPILFGPRAHRVTAILDALVAQRPYTGQLVLEAHPFQLTEPVVRRLADVGTLQIGIGLQTISGEANRLMHRRFDASAYDSLLTRLNDYGLPYYIDIIYGLPGDTFHGFLDTMDFVLPRVCSEAQFYRLLVFPGTRFHAQAKDLGLAHSPRPPYEVLRTSSYSFGEIIQSHRLAFAYHALIAALLDGKRVREVLTFGNRPPSSLLDDLVTFLDRRGFMGTTHPSALAETGFKLRYTLQEYLRQIGE